MTLLDEGRRIAPSVRSILVVEDDEAINTLVTRLLTAWGYEVRRAGDGIEALSEIERSRPDLVLADVMMPRVSGIDLVALLREREIEVPIVLFSAYDGHRGLPAVPFLSKPFTIAQFSEAVRSALGE
ncbi:MAG: response regulator [Thermomicrobiales bacterium]